MAMPSSHTFLNMVKKSWRPQPNQAKILMPLELTAYLNYIAKQLKKSVSPHIARTRIEGH